jgi:antitoxin (DNA-binding transcriptional repressor) of toxin-antitoxin stability system
MTTRLVPVKQQRKRRELARLRRMENRTRREEQERQRDLAHKRAGRS